MLPSSVSLNLMPGKPEVIMIFEWVYPAHIVVSQAEVRLVADETANANAATIKSDQQRVEAAQDVEAAQTKTFSLNFVT